MYLTAKRLGHLTFCKSKISHSISDMKFWTSVKNDLGFRFYLLKEQFLHFGEYAIFICFQADLNEVIDSTYVFVWQI